MLFAIRRFFVAMVEIVWIILNIILLIFAIRKGYWTPFIVSLILFAIFTTMASGGIDIFEINRNPYYW